MRKLRQEVVFVIILHILKPRFQVFNLYTYIVYVQLNNSGLLRRATEQLTENVCLNYL